jgi:hypothetical protein
MRLIDRLKSTYPRHEFQMDPVTAVISFSSDGYSVTDPFASDCGRFPAEPRVYGLSTADAVEIFGHNMPLGATYSVGPK